MRQPIVIKIGSSSLTSADGGLDEGKVAFFASEIAGLMDRGHAPLLVTSGAVAAGFRAIGLPGRPKLLHEKQAAAAVGQALLMKAYHEAFARHGRTVAQLLLTRADFFDRVRVHNALMTVTELVRRGVLPVINENDTVSVGELKFGDNDRLSALVANLVKAERLVIITDTDGLYTDDPRKNADARKIDRVGEIGEELLRIAGGAGSDVGTGGMRSKIEAARLAMRGGVPVFIGRAGEPGDLEKALRGEGKGTYFDTDLHFLPVKKQWIGFHSIPQGLIRIDDGAVDALLRGGKSLLPAGVRAVDGEFHPGDVVEVADLSGAVIGRGVINYASWQLVAVAGLSVAEAQKRIDVHRPEVIHRDEWVAL
jgi:glutamate 5-kinase